MGWERAGDHAFPYRDLSGAAGRPVVCADADSPRWRPNIPVGAQDFGVALRRSPDTRVDEALPLPVVGRPVQSVADRGVADRSASSQCTRPILSQRKRR
jgi:hypothetical protein